jgi:uncharacterized repeat protein (TIGR03803 family)
MFSFREDSADRVERLVSGFFAREMEEVDVFTGRTDGSLPFARLILDLAGNLYGTTDEGGTKNTGVVFKIGPYWTAPKNGVSALAAASS